MNLRLVVAKATFVWTAKRCPRCWYQRRPDKLYPVATIACEDHKHLEKRYIELLEAERGLDNA